MSVQSFDSKKVAITLSDAAKAHYLSAIEKAGGMAIRLFTKKAGCSGLMYKSEVAETKRDDDLVAYDDGEIKILLKQKSAPYLNGISIDFEHQTLGQSQITYTNPNESARCGCGESFMVDSEKNSKKDEF